MRLTFFSNRSRSRSRTGVSRSRIDCPTVMSSTTFLLRVISQFHGAIELNRISQSHSAMGRLCPLHSRIQNVPQPISDAAHAQGNGHQEAVSYTHLRAHETRHD